MTPHSSVTDEVPILTTINAFPGPPGCDWPLPHRRTARNPLFPVNLADMLVRHSSANHKRETIAWSKRRQGSAERLAVFLVWRNYMKGRKEKVRGSPTPAQVRGMLDHRLSGAELLKRRLFVSRIELPRRWREYYGKTVSTRVLAKQRRHELKYAM